MKEDGSPEDLRRRTRRYSLDVIALVEALPRRRAAYLLGDQLFRSGTSVGSHYREGCRARSDAEFISKMEVALQELDESDYWLDLLIGSGIFDNDFSRRLWQETDELIRIFVTIVRKAKGQ